MCLGDFQIKSAWFTRREATPLTFCKFKSKSVWQAACFGWSQYSTVGSLVNTNYDAKDKKIHLVLWKIYCSAMLTEIRNTASKAGWNSGCSVREKLFQNLLLFQSGIKAKLLKFLGKPETKILLWNDQNMVCSSSRGKINIRLPPSPTHTPPLCSSRIPQ